MEKVTKLDTCLACGSPDLELMLDLTDQPLANSFVEDPSIAEDRFPLAVNLCNRCYHLQLTHVVDPAIIYKHYLYVSGTTQTYKDYMKWFASFALEYYQTRPTSVLDIGCNDGTQLNYFKDLGLKTYGIDPAENLYPISSKNHEVICDFFNPGTAKRLEGRDIDIIVAQNSFAHNPDPVSYLRALSTIMHDDSLFFIQTSQSDMVYNNEFDTIYHEHVNFYNINSMRELAARAGMYLVDVVKTPIHGISYVFVLSKTRSSPYRIKNMVDMEALDGLLSRDRYVQWAEKVNRLVDELAAVIKQAKKDGYVLAGYGAAAKGNTLLNFKHICLDFIIDDNPLKQGTFSPGTHIPVVSNAHLDRYTEEDRILFIPLAWNFFDEIKKKILIKRNVPTDKFVRYFPHIQVQ